MRREKKKPVLPRRVAALGKRITQWRQTRKKSKAMPAGLWREAVKLAETHGTCRIARAVRIDYSALRRRVNEQKVQRDPPCTPPGFVQWRPMSLPLGVSEHARSAHHGTEVEYSDPQGAKLICRVAEGMEVDVAALAEQFWSRER